MQRLDKLALTMALRSALRDARDRMMAAQRTSAEGVTHEDAKSEGDKDMRATEASYIARGQAKRVEELEAELGKVIAFHPKPLPEGSRVVLGAVVRVDEEAGERVIFLAPAGGGTSLTVDGVGVHVVSPSSPLGKALLGASAGDAVLVRRGGVEDEITIVAVE